MSAPVCPADSVRTANFVETTWGRRAADTVRAAPAAVATRRRRMVELRAGGRFRDAERYGWMALAGVLVGIGSVELATLDPGSISIHAKAGPHDFLPAPFVDDPPPRHVVIPGSGLVVADPTDPAGFALMALAAAVASGAAAVAVDGRKLSAGAVGTAIAARLRKASRCG